MTCLTPEQIELLAGEPAESGVAEELRRHLALCAACRQAVENWGANEEVLHCVKQLGAWPQVREPAEKTYTALSEAADTTQLSPATGKGASEPQERVLPRADLFPGYELIRELSRGGQGVVYLANQIGTRRRVAIKTLHQGAHAADAAVRRFEREIELVAQLDHPNIVAIFHNGVARDGQQFYVMDYVEGVPLRQYVRQSAVTLEKLLALFVLVCKAVEHAHRRGVIHRDLKPSNILVDADGQPKVLDFGLARQLLQFDDEQLTLSYEMMGTLPYMSPEQARGRPAEIDTRTDVYALGVILYELLTGRFPYPVHGQLAEVLRNITETPPTPPSKAWSQESGITGRRAHRLRGRQSPIDDDLQTIVLKALVKERERRYPSVTELSRDIEHYLAGEAIEAKRDSTWYVLRKLARRNLPATITVASVFVIAVSAAVTSFEFYREAQKALDAKLASESRLATEGQAFDATADDARATLSRLSLGWFLLEWHGGRLQHARAIMAKTAPHLPEYAAMRFLLDPNISPEQFLAQVPVESVGLAYFVAGEREFRAGDLANAKRWYERCVAAHPLGRVTESARARLEQLPAETGTAALKTEVNPPREQTR